MAESNVHLQAGLQNNGAEGNEYEESSKDDVSDYQTEERASKSLSPSATETESNAAQARPHAAVEKRYRRTVNTKLQQLHASIPADGKFVLKDEQQHNEVNNANETEQAAKPAVLDKAVQYISHLVETYQRYDQDIQALRKQVRDLVDDDGGSQSSGTTAYERPPGT